MTITIKVWWLATALVLILVAEAAILSAPVFSQSVFKQAPPVVKVCELVNTADTIEIRYCTNDMNGYSYYINSLGFLMPESN